MFDQRIAQLERERTIHQLQAKCRVLFTMAEVAKQGGDDATFHTLVTKWERETERLLQLYKGQVSS